MLSCLSHPGQLAEVCINKVQIDLSTPVCMKINGLYGLSVFLLLLYIDQSEPSVPNL